MIYTFTKQNAAPDLLHSELVVIPGFKGLTLSGDNLSIIFTEELSAAQKHIMTTIINLHDGSSFNQKQKDTIRFMRRAAVKDDILVQIAADNMERVRSGEWTVAQLISLTQDSELKNLLDDINTLSYEIAYSKISTMTNELLTTAIKDGWKSRLASHFYLE